MLQGSVLAIAGLISKAIGFIYRIPMANIMGNEGNGLYSVAFGIYNIALTLSSYSMPLAVSKLMSSRLSEGRNKDAHRIFSISFIFALIMGSLAWAGLLFGANFFIKSRDFSIRFLSLHPQPLSLRFLEHAEAISRDTETWFQLQYRRCWSRS